MIASLGDILVQYLRQEGLEKPLLEHQVVERWGEIMGPLVQKMTRSVEMENGVLMVKLSSAALRSQLFDCRRQLIQKINEQMGAEVVRDVRLT